MLSKELFELLKTEKKHILVSAFEIVGENAFDLLSEERNKVQLMEDSKGLVQVLGQQSFFITSPENLIESYMLIIYFSCFFFKFHSNYSCFF